MVDQPNARVPIANPDGTMSLPFLRELQQIVNALNGSTDAISGRITLSLGGVLTVIIGAGTPEGQVTAGPPSLYLNKSGGSHTTLYVKESGTGNTGWIGK